MFGLTMFLLGILVLYNARLVSKVSKLECAVYGHDPLDKERHGIRYYRCSRCGFSSTKHPSALADDVWRSSLVRAYDLDKKLGR